MDDTKIIELYFERDEQAVKETELKYGRLCYGIAYNVLNNRQDAEECVNDTYAGMWNAIPPAKPNRLMAFVARIARNTALKRLEYLTRDKRYAGISVSLEELAEVLPDESYAPHASEETVGALISRFLKEQKADVRNVFVRRYYFFDSVAEIAKRCSFTESKVKSMLFYTRKKLKEYLVKEGVEI